MAIIYILLFFDNI